MLQSMDVIYRCQVTEKQGKCDKLDPHYAIDTDARMQKRNPVLSLRRDFHISYKPFSKTLVLHTILDVSNAFKLLP